MPEFVVIISRFDFEIKSATILVELNSFSQNLSWKSIVNLHTKHSNDGIYYVWMMKLTHALHWYNCCIKFFNNAHVSLFEWYLLTNDWWLKWNIRMHVIVGWLIDWLVYWLITWMVYQSNKRLFIREFFTIQYPVKS